MKIYGLIGKNISYSFSGKYFTEKFEKEQIRDSLYKIFDIPDITHFLQIIKKNKELKGLNVTIPYKQEIIPYLDKLSSKAEQIGAVNVIRVTKNGKLKGYNSDCYGFEKSITPLLQPHHTKALILGTGGASKAIEFVLNKLGIQYKFVSRKPVEGQFTYEELSQEILSEYTIIINCTPLGTFPNIEDCPTLNYSFLSDKHLAFDLVYNPSETKFLRLAKSQGAITQNGYDMLVFQAEKAWKIWNK
jgi:shikimate dehydrogenase